MTSNQIKYFLGIVEWKSFSRAAGELYISQSSLSKQIKSLENELGEKLFFRNGPRVELTDYGEAFLKYAKKTFAEYIDFLNLFQGRPTAGGQANTLRLGVLPVLFGYDFMGIISRFLVCCEHIQLELHENGQAILMKMLDKRQLDAVIAYSDFIQPQKYEYVPANRDDLCVVCSRNHPLAEFDALSLARIRDERLIILEESASTIYRMLYNACLAEGFIPKIVSTSNRHEHLLSMIQDNSGVMAALPEKLAAGDSRHIYDVKIIQLDEKIHTTTSFIKRKDTEEKPCLAEFVGFWAREIKDTSKRLPTLLTG